MRIEDFLFVLDPSTNEDNETVKIPYNLRLQDTLQFNLMISEVNATGYGRIDVDTGEPINVTLYAHNCKFATARVLLIFLVITTLSTNYLYL